MKIKVQIVIESDGGDTKTVENIACLERGRRRPEDLGLTLDEARDLLESAQRTLVEQQVAEYLEQQAHCPYCGKKRRRKGHHNPLVYRTLFGVFCPKPRNFRRPPLNHFYTCLCEEKLILEKGPIGPYLIEYTQNMKLRELKF